MSCTKSNNEKTCIGESVQVSSNRWQDYFFKSTSKLNLVGPSTPASGSNKWKWIILVVLLIGIVSFIGAFFALNRHSGQLKTLYHEMSSNMNSSLDPCDDFYEYACGRFPERHEVPPATTEVNYFKLEMDKMKNKIMDILDGHSLTKKNKPLQLLKRIWDSCLKKSDVQSNLKSLMEYFRQLDTLDTWQDRFARVTKDGYNVLLSLEPGRDPNFMYSRVMHIDKPKLKLAGFIGAGNSELNLYYSNLLLIANNDQGRLWDYSDQANEVIEFERKILNATTPEVERIRDQGAIGQKSYIQTLDKATGFNWTQILYIVVNKTYSPYESLYIADPKYIENFASLISEKNSSFLTSYIKMAVARENCFILGEHCRMYQTLLWNSTYAYPMDEFEKRTCFDTISEHMEDLLMKAFMSNDPYWLSEFSARRMAGSLMSQFDDLIGKLSWMDNTTATAARKKIGEFQYKVDTKMPYWLDYDGQLESYFINVPFINETSDLNMFTAWRQISEYKRTEKMKLLISWSWGSEPWPISLFTDHPKLVQSTGYMYVPAMVLQGHYFNEDYPENIKYGLLGTQMGHAMTHAVDGLAAKHHNRTSSEFWTQDTSNNFTSHMQCLVDAYRREFIKINGKDFDQRIDGSTTLNENLADLIGLQLAYKAYKNSTAKESSYPGEFSGYSHDQMFFLSFANAHCTNDKFQWFVDMFIGTHSPRKYRVNVPLKQMPEFAQAFQCWRGQRMHPSEKCRVE